MTTIDKHNYEAYLLDYLEGTISTQDKEQLLAFLDRHPEYKADIDTDVTLTLNDSSGDVFAFKSELLKHPADAFDLPVKDYLFIKEKEEGLNKAEEAELVLIEPNVEKRVAEKKAYSLTTLKVDIIAYPNKSNHRRFILLPTIKQLVVNRVAAAVAIIAVVSSVWMLQDFTTVEPFVAEQNETKEHNKAVNVADAKIVEKTLVNESKPSKDSLLQLAEDPLELKTKDKSEEQVSAQVINEGKYLASIGVVKPLKHKRINAYEHGLNVMMPQYMSNNLLRKELAAIYRKIEDDQETPALSLALVENGVKVMNFFSKESVKMKKYYNDEGKVVAYTVEGDNLEVKRRAK